MADLHKNIEESLKNSFSRVKQHINLIEEEVKANRNFLIKQNKQIQDILNKISSIFEHLDKISSDMHDNTKKEDNLAFSKSSIGNEGVYSFIHSSDIHSLNNYSTKRTKYSSFTNFNRDVKDLFQSLSRQELLVFLTIYELSEQNKYVTYSQIASKLGLSEGCIRTYISSLIRKNIPIIKEKYNNKQVLLSINSHFKEIGLKNKLEELFYEVDPAQKKLIDNL